ncbi:MAG: carboxyltransferase domain-containing protein [Rhodobacteraceae bacterium]|nr:carboxyltransferase domain-containing protein [Paracoccaceae bacterium]
MTDTASKSAPEILPLGPGGVLVRFALTPDPLAIGAAQAFCARVQERALEGADQIATSLASVLVTFDPAATQRSAVASALNELLQEQDWSAAGLPPLRRLWTIPVSLGGESGPQISEVAELTGRSEAQIAEDIQNTDLRVLAIGFAPGQPYFGLMPPAWDIQRQRDLTPRVPAGAVVVAVRQVIIFGQESVTGWRRIGHSAFRPFDRERPEPFALEPADGVRLAVAPHSEIAELERSGDSLGGARCEVLQ